jgi:integrase
VLVALLCSWYRGATGDSHTFASYFIMATNDILSLQKILGHLDLKMTMRYPHLAEGHLDKVIANNPLTALTLG